MSITPTLASANVIICASWWLNPSHTFAAVVGDLHRDLKTEDHPSDSKRVAVAATTLPLLDVPNQLGMTEGRAITGYLTKEAVHCLKPGSEFGYEDNYIVLDQDE